MNEFLENLKRQAAENPMLALGSAAAVLTALSQFLNAGNKHRYAKAWSKEVARRAAKSK